MPGLVPWHPEPLMFGPVPRSARQCLWAVGAITLISACSSGSSSSSPSTTTTTRPAPRAIHATVGKVDVASSGKIVAFADADRDAVLASIDRYVAAATLAPLGGKAATNLAADFTTATAPALTGPEQDALTDTSVPKATGAVKTTLAPLNLTALSDQQGAIDLVGATFDLTVNTTATGGPVTIHRTGEFVLTRDGGAWKILGFTLAVTRDGAGLGAPASATTGSSRP